MYYLKSYNELTDSVTLFRYFVLPFEWIFYSMLDFIICVGHSRK